MKKRYIFICVLVLVLVIAGLIVAMKGGNSAVDDVSTNVPTQEITEENNAPESNPTSVPTEIPTSVPTDDSESATQEPTPTLSLEITKIPHSILTSIPTPTKGVDEDEEIDIPFAPTSFPSDDNNEDKPNKDDAIDFPNDDVEPTKAPSLVTPRPNVTLKPTKAPQISEAPKATSTPIPTQKVEVTPTSTPKATNTPIPTQAPSANGKVELESIGISIPKRDDFNEDGLNKDKAWWGDVDDTKSGQKLMDTLDSIYYTMVDKNIISKGTQAFLLQDNQISWDWISFSGTHDFSLVRDTTNGEYVLEINLPLDEFELYSEDHAPYNRDIVLTMVSCISSTPSELVNYIMIGLYEDASILNDMVPQKVGDCQVLIDTNSSYKGHYVFKFKPN